MLLGAFRGGNPLEREVGVPSLCRRRGGVLQQHGLDVNQELAANSHGESHYGAISQYGGVII